MSPERTQHFQDLINQHGHIEQSGSVSFRSLEAFLKAATDVEIQFQNLGWQSIKCDLCGTMARGVEHWQKGQQDPILTIDTPPLPSPKNPYASASSYEDHCLEYHKVRRDRAYALYQKIATDQPITLTKEAVSAIQEALSYYFRES